LLNNDQKIQLSILTSFRKSHIQDDVLYKTANCVLRSKCQTFCGRRFSVVSDSHKKSTALSAPLFTKLKNV